MASKWLAGRKARTRSRTMSSVSIGLSPSHNGDDRLSTGRDYALSPSSGQQAARWAATSSLSMVERSYQLSDSAPKFGRGLSDEFLDDSDSCRDFGRDSRDPSRRPSKYSCSDASYHPNFTRTRLHRRSSAMSSSVFGESSYDPDSPAMSRKSSDGPYMRKMSSEVGRRVSHAVSHRRSSRIAARRMSLLNTGIRVPEELSLNPVTIGGHLYDFILRSMSRPLYGYDVYAQELSELIQRDFFLEYDPTHKHADAVAIMLKEALYLVIARFLTPELKQRAVRPWPPTKQGLLGKISRQLVNNRRQAKCLETEIRQWRKKYSQLSKHTHQDQSRQKFQKLEKVVGFWLDYHGRTWNTDETIAPAPKSPRRSKLLLPSSSMPSFPSFGDTLSEPLSPASLFNRSHTQLPPLTGASFMGRPVSPLTPVHGRPISPLPLTPSNRGESRGSMKSGSADSRGNRLPTVASRVKYLSACDGHFIPKTLSFVTGHSARLEAAGRNLLDHDLLAIVGTLPKATIDTVDLCDCKSLSDKSLVPFLGGLVNCQAKKTLRKLSLRQCVRAALGSQNMVVEVLQVIEHLRHLDISCIHVALKYQWPLCEAIREHAYLETAILSDIGLGNNPKTKDCIGALGNSKLKTMDIGWNCFNADEFLCFAEKLRDNDWIRSLRLPSSTAKPSSNSNSDSPISFFLEQLGYVKPLRHLDISHNGIDYSSALVLEDALEHHKNLTHIDLSGNALGVLGCRSFLRLMSQSHNGLIHFECRDSYFGASPLGLKVQIFRTSNPSGKYDFDMVRPYHRTFLRMLYKTCERFKITPDQAFQNISYSAGGYKHPSKDSEGFRVVPTQGTISLSFNNERCIEAQTQGHQDEDFAGFILRHYEATRFRIAFDKIVPIMSAWRGLNGLQLAQSNFLRALSVDFALTLPQVEAFADSCKSRADEIISMLLPCLPEDKVSRGLAKMIFPSCELYLESEPRTRHLYNLNIDNPTGHYNLDLGNSCDFAVAMNLMLLDQWEVLVDRRKHREDISSRGTRSHLRNEHYRSIPLLEVCESITEWNLPETDCFEFDYASSARPPQGVEVLGAKNFDIMLTELSDCTAPPEDKICVLRALSSHFYLTAMQLRQMLGVFRTKQERAEAFVIFYFRIVDMCNAKVFLCRFGSSEEKLKLQKRLGYAAFFPFIQPENERFVLDLAFHDQRICCMLLVTLSLHEKAGNIREPRYILADGTEDPLTQGVPRSWEMFEKVPTSGVFSASYVCAPDDRSFDLRKKLESTYGYFKTSQAMYQVLWWTGLSEPPHDVIVFLQFLLHKTTSAEKAFHMMDTEGTGIITLRSLEDSIDALGCNKFDGDDKFGRIEIIFRYLDPGMIGGITKDEWEVIKQLWNEFEHTVCEFAQFLVRTFGEDFTEAWEALHEELELEDMDELFSKEQFMKGVEDLGYFGPTEIVFAMLDRNDDNLISEEEFQLLIRYKKLPNLTRKGRSAMRRGATFGGYSSEAGSKSSAD